MVADLLIKINMKFLAKLLILILIITIPSFADKVTIFEFTENELSELEVRKVRGADNKTEYSVGSNVNGNYLKAVADNAASGLGKKVKIDLNKLLIIKNDNEFKINNTEKIILEKMINNPGKTFSREDIGQLIELDKERSIDVIITRLRKKIEIDPKSPKFLQTIRGAGYVLWIE